MVLYIFKLLNVVKVETVSAIISASNASGAITLTNLTYTHKLSQVVFFVFNKNLIWWFGEKYNGKYQESGSNPRQILKNINGKIYFFKRIFDPNEFEQVE